MQIKFVSVNEMKMIEQQADKAGLSYAQMMENAGRSVSRWVQDRCSIRLPIRILALVGSGNNGGDALVALADLAQKEWETVAYIVRPRPEDDPLLKRCNEAGTQIIDGESDVDFVLLASQLMPCSVLLDGVLGTGFRLPLSPDISKTLLYVRETISLMEDPPTVVAVDCPSGVDCDEGRTASECIPADLTVTMAAIKHGLLKFPAANFTGEVVVGEIGKLEQIPAWQTVKRFVVDRDWIRSILPARPRTAHKGTFGTALVVAGSINYTGAAFLAGKAAYRSGCGLVTLAVPYPLHTTLAGQFPEATWLILPDEMGVIAEGGAAMVKDHLTRITSLLIGPGLGLEKTTQDFLNTLLDSTVGRKSIGFIHSSSEKPETNSPLPPLILDADGLKLLSHIPNWPKLLPKLSVLTPHPGEMSVLTGKPIDMLLEDKVKTVEEFSQQWGHVIILKGAFTVIGSPDGVTAIIPVATPALARAGTGDVLSGLVAGLLAQGMPPFKAAVSAAWIHAQAGLYAQRRLGTPVSVLAGDVLDSITEVFTDLSK
jgi:hydroxyethylthiazole kinase-like uncharacterized protein yjeF